MELLLVDIDHVIPGTVDETDGAVSMVSTPNAASYDVIDEIADERSSQARNSMSAALVVMSQVHQRAHRLGKTRAERQLPAQDQSLLLH